MLLFCREMQASETIFDKSSSVSPPSKTRPLTGYFNNLDIFTPPFDIAIFLVGAFSIGKGIAK
jgi:hypothetical protein